MPKTCSQCQTENPDEANHCMNCGARLAGATTAGPAVGQPAAAGAGPAAASGGSSVPAYHFDAARWTTADIICGIATFVLFIALFLDWFSISLGPISVTWSGLSAHGYLYVDLILCIAIIIYLALRAGWDEIPVSVKVPHLTVMMVATLVNLVLVIIGFIQKPGGYSVTGVGWSFGAILALIAAVVAAAPYAIPQLRAKTM